VYAKGFGSDNSDATKNVRLMSTGELRKELAMMGVNADDCEDRTDLERKVTRIRRGNFLEGQVKTSSDAGGYLTKKRGELPSVSVTASDSQESKAGAFDQAMHQSVEEQRAQASKFDATIQGQLDHLKSKGQRVFDLLEYPCDHEIKIVGAKESDIEDNVRAIIGGITGADPKSLVTSSREKGKWVSVSVMAPVQSSDMLYDCYSKLQAERSFRYVI